MTWTPADLLPHAGTAVLLDAILAWDDGHLAAGVTVRPDSAFCGADGVPAHIGIEYMAQACGAYSGAVARGTGGAPRLGFLLGTRGYKAQRDHFPPGSELRVEVDLVFSDAEVGMFDCRILCDGTSVAAAQLVVAQLANGTALMAAQEG